MRILFWNINRNENIGHIVGKLAEAHKVDIVVLAESPQEQIEAIRQHLKKECRESPYFQFFSFTNCVQIYSRTELEDLKAGNRYGVWKVGKDNSAFLLFGAHLKSQLNDNAPDHDAAKRCRDFKEDIAKLQKESGVSKTIVIGDLNANPFEPALVQSDSFFAMSDRKLALKWEQITIESKPSRMMYNPMWGLFGDTTPGPSGTYYSDRGSSVRYYWNMYDQVLVSQDLIEKLPESPVRILDEVKGISLAKEDGRPDLKYSDHFPLLFEMNL